VQKKKLKRFMKKFPKLLLLLKLVLNLSSKQFPLQYVGKRELMLVRFQLVVLLAFLDTLLYVSKIVNQELILMVELYVLEVVQEDIEQIH